MSTLCRSRSVAAAMACASSSDSGLGVALPNRLSNMKLTPFNCASARVSSLMGLFSVDWVERRTHVRTPTCDVGIVRRQMRVAANGVLQVRERNAQAFATLRLRTVEPGFAMAVSAQARADRFAFTKVVILGRLAIAIGARRLN